jgi:hypothetical protein
MADKQVNTFGPVAMSATMTTNIYNNTSALIKDLIDVIQVCNKTATAATFNLFLGATGANAAGTELFFTQSVPAYTTSYFYLNGMVMTSTQFLVGGASVATTLTITGWGRQQVV